MIFTNKGFLGAEMFSFLVKFLITGVVFVVFVMLIKSQLDLDVDIAETEAEVFFYKSIYAKNGISYYDDQLDLVHPGIVDLKNVIDQKDPIEKRLESLYSYSAQDSSFIAAKYEIQNDAGQTIDTFYYKEDLFTRIEPLSYGGDGPGSSRRIVHALYVLLSDSELVKAIDGSTYQNIKLRKSTNNAKSSSISTINSLDADQKQIQELVEKKKLESVNNQNLIQGRLVVTIVVQNI